jgi:hypothetical protein
MHNPYDESIRNDTAKNYKEIRRILRGNMAEIEPEPPKNRFWLWLGVAGLVLGAICLFAGCSMASTDKVGLNDFTDNQFVNAIYMAEGGGNATYAYGIRSIHYKTQEQARRICLQTVRNNRRRFTNYGYKHYPSFIIFLQSRYCPDIQRNPHQGESWAKNVAWYLKHQSKG